MRRPTVAQYQQMRRQLDVAEAALWRVVELAPTTEWRRAERLCWRIKYLRTNVLDAMVDAHGTGPRSEPAPRFAGVCRVARDGLRAVVLGAALPLATKASRIEDRLLGLRSRLEDRMFRDHPAPRGSPEERERLRMFFGKQSTPNEGVANAPEI